MRILVCGGRDFGDWNRVRETLDALNREHRIDVIIHGAATGADMLGKYWGEINGRRTEAYQALWRGRGNTADSTRTKRMLDEGKPDLVVAFPGGVGTAGMVGLARAAGVKVIEVSRA